MEHEILDEAAELLEKANADLDPRLCSETTAAALLRRYARIEKLAAYGKAALAGRVADVGEVARASGTSIGRARKALESGWSLARSPELDQAVRHAEISLDQADEIAKTEALEPGATEGLLDVARNGTFHALRDRARRIRLDAQTGPQLTQRQHQARHLRHRVTDLGMVCIEAELEPHLGTPIVQRLETVAGRLARSHTDRNEPFERHLADALSAIFEAKAGRPGRRPELVVVVSHEVATRGWRDVKGNEICKIPGVGPISPQAAKEIAQDAFLTGVFYDGTDLRYLRRWTRNIPVEVRIALELGDPPEFDGVKCLDCGNRFHIEFDHQQPHAAGGPASTENVKPRCLVCHIEKTQADRRSGRLKERAPP